MTSPAEKPESSFEDVLVDALSRIEQQGRGGIEAAIAAHPAHATALRSHLDRLLRLGLLTATAPADPVTASNVAAFPEQLGDFRLLQRLGGGGMGVVYLAEQQSLGRRVALKLVRADFLHHPSARERFRREVDAIARLQHPGIVPVHAAGEDNGVPWLAMEHVVGASLDEVLSHFAGRDPSTLRGDDLRRAVLAITATRRNPKDSAGTDTTNTFAGTWTSACLRIARAIALALQHAHERGVLHRDVKPSNVMLTPDGRVLLLDFGLATSVDGVRMTATGNALGTPAYMSPEQMRGEAAAVDGRTDVYSLGVTLYELLAMHIPYAAATAHAIRELALAGRTTPLHRHHRSIARDVELVCSRAIDLEPAHRYGDIAAFAADLTNLLELRPITAAPPSAWRMLRRAAQRHPARTVTAVAAVLLFLVAPTVFLLQQHSANTEIGAALQKEQKALKEAQQQGHQARLARDEARAQRDLAREVVDSMLTEVASGELADLPRLQTFRMQLLERARVFYERFLADNEGDPELLEPAVRAAMQVVYLDGQLGETDQGHRIGLRAAELARRLLARRPGDVDATLLLADVLLTIGRIEELRADSTAAITNYAEARRLTRSVLAQQPRHPLAIAHLLGVERGAQLASMHLGDAAGMQESLQAMAELWDSDGDALLGHDYHDVAIDHVLCAFGDAAQKFAEQGDHQAALAALDRCERTAATIDPAALGLAAKLTLTRLATLRAALAAADGDFAGQEAGLREGMRLADAVLVDYRDDTNALRGRAQASNQLALLLIEHAPDRLSEAIPLLEASAATLRHLIVIDPSVLDNKANLAGTLVNLGSQHQDAHDPAAAKVLFLEAITLAQQCCTQVPTRMPWQQTLYNAVWFLGQVQGELGDHQGQAAAAEQLAGLRPDDGRTHRIAAQLLGSAIGKLASATDVPEAERTARRGELTASAMGHLRTAARLGCTDFTWLRDNPAFAPLRSQPEFAALQQQFAANADAAQGR